MLALTTTTNLASRWEQTSSTQNSVSNTQYDIFGTWVTEFTSVSSTAFSSEDPHGSTTISLGGVTETRSETYNANTDTYTSGKYTTYAYTSEANAFETRITDNNIRRSENATGGVTIEGPEGVLPVTENTDTSPLTYHSLVTTTLFNELVTTQTIDAFIESTVYETYHLTETDTDSPTSTRTSVNPTLFLTVDSKALSYGADESYATQRSFEVLTIDQTSILVSIATTEVQYVKGKDPETFYADMTANLSDVSAIWTDLPLTEITSYRADLGLQRSELKRYSTYLDSDDSIQYGPTLTTSDWSIYYETANATYSALVENFGGITTIQALSFGTLTTETQFTTTAETVESNYEISEISRRITNESNTNIATSTLRAETENYTETNINRTGFTTKWAFYDHDAVKYEDPITEYTTVQKQRFAWNIAPENVTIFNTRPLNEEFDDTFTWYPAFGSVQGYMNFPFGGAVLPSSDMGVVSDWGMGLSLPTPFFSTEYFLGLEYSAVFPNVSAIIQDSNAYQFKTQYTVTADSEGVSATKRYSYDDGTTTGITTESSTFTPTLISQPVNSKKSTFNQVVNSLAVYPDPFNGTGTGDIRQTIHDSTGGSSVITGYLSTYQIETGLAFANEQVQYAVTATHLFPLGYVKGYTTLNGKRLV